MQLITTFDMEKQLQIDRYLRRLSKCDWISIIDIEKYGSGWKVYHMLDWTILKFQIIK